MAILPVADVLSTHLRAADIIVEQVCGTLTFKITIIGYMNSLSNTRFGTNSEILFGDGGLEKIPLTESTPRPDLGPNVSLATYSVTHTYAAPGIYTITYIERDRSSGVLNIRNSDDVPYVTSVRINLENSQDCNHYPVLAVVPLDRGCSKMAFFHSPGAYDVDGDSLSYAMTIPASGETTFAQYDDPASAKFYTDFNAGNEAGTATPTFVIDPLSGLITWDAPGATGEYNIAFRITEWRIREDGSYYELSSTVRDMQIIIELCSNTRPALQVPTDLCVEAGASVAQQILGSDKENHAVKIELFSEILDITADRNPATFSPDPPEFVIPDPASIVTFQWNTTCDHIRKQPYQIVVKITDSPPEGPKLVTFKSWNIRVVAPAPVIRSTTLDVIRNHGVIEWEEYACPDPVRMQVWRKVGSFEFNPGNCDIGIPGNSGYQLVGETDVPAKNFVDTNFGMGLSPGAVYCYRLVVLIRDTKSKVSAEFCIGPVKRDAPVITHVSVVNTLVEGKVRVSWRSPLDINKEQFPEPYGYEIYRADDFAGDAALRKKAYVTDTTWVDESVNTKDSVFNYRIVVYSKPPFSDTVIPVDTSAAASTVWLDGIPGNKSISLQWQDSVPWSNVDQARPWHLIYRANGISQESSLMLYDSVNVIADGFRYTDNDVAEDEIYTYRVVTRGTYGNPSIPLQENFSQSVSVYPQNDLKPCAPALTLNNMNCDDYLSLKNCDQTLFTNEISWSPVLDPGCRVDIVRYKIYAGNGMDTVFTLLDDTERTTLSETGLPSPIRCYRISAVDALGQEGPFAESCVDSCPFFQLPNVFTPNQDGCNDLFSARYEGDGQEICRLNQPESCPRFVKKITLQVYNRWGAEVFSFDSGRAGSVYVDWDGKDLRGRELAAGVYYYTASIEFEALETSRRHLTIKDWVHLVR